MYIGHFAVGFALKARFPQVPALPIMLGVGIMDIFNGIFVIAGISKVTANLNAGPYLYFDLTFIDWDHSMLMAAVIACLWGLVFVRNTLTALVAVAAVASHWLTDWPMHNSDLALYPHSAVHFGWGLWGQLGIYSWLLEGLFAAALVYYAWRQYAKAGVKLIWPSVLMVALFLQLSPWLAPTKFAAMLAEPSAHIVCGVMIAMGFIVPGLILTWMFDRAGARVCGDC